MGKRIPKWRTIRLPLAEHEIQVWSVAASELQGVFETLEQFLAEDEMHRADKYRFDRDRTLFVTCRGLLRVLLAAFTGLDPRHVQFATGPVGKPYLVTQEGLAAIRFNVSHSHGRVLLGFSRVRELGVDVEQVRAMDDLEGLAQRYFAPEEQTDLANRDDGGRLRHFFTIWALKEAYLKGTGKGLTTPLDSFYVSPLGDPPESTRYAVIGRTGDGVGPWSLRTLPNISGFAAAIAVEGAGWYLSERTGQDLMELMPAP